MRGLTQAAAIELGPHNILVNSYAPGIIDTKMWKVVEQGKKGLRISAAHSAAEHAKKFSTLKRVGSSEEVANVVSWLAHIE